MKINSIQNSNNFKSQLSFKAGVTEFYSDFDGTFMPYKYRHDVFCKDGDEERIKFLRSGKEKFREYFDGFKKFIQTARGQDGDKFNFTLTSGRNRPEYNYYMERIRQDGLSVPLPDRLIIRNGGDIYTKRRDIADFFKSGESEVFLKTDFSQAKRNAVKTATNGWDGDKIRGVLKGILGTMALNENRMTVFEADTDGSFYKYGMHIKDKLKMMSLDSEKSNYAALKENGNLEFHMLFPYHLGDTGTLETIKETLNKKIDEDGVSVYSKIHRARNEKSFGEISFSPLINGGKIDKVFDTKPQVQKIIKEGLNDLVIAAGDDANDIRMLNLFEYIEGGTGAEVFDADNLKKIYDLPFIAIFVDNHTVKNKDKDMLRISRNGVPYDKIDDYFNSDGNVRFIHVIPDNEVGKPQNLQEATQLAIREYARRNEEFRKNLSLDMQKLIADMDYEYPIDKSVSESLEASLGVKLWNPAPALKKTVFEQIDNTKKNGNFKKILPIALGVGTVIAFGALLIRKTVNDKNKTENNSHKISQNDIINNNLLTL